MTGRNVTAAFKTEIATDVVHPRLLVEAQFTSGIIYLWNGVGDLSWNSQTWLGVGNLLTISNVVESTEIKVNNLTVEFSGITTAYKALALTQVELNNDVTLRMALLDSNGAVIADPEILFKGKMDAVNIAESATGSRFRLTVNNRLVELQKVKERRYTKADQLQIAPTDTGLRHVVNSSKSVPWGSTE